MKKGNETEMQGAPQDSSEWKKAYLECFSHCAVSEERRARMRAVLLADSLGKVDAPVNVVLPSAVVSHSVVAPVVHTAVRHERNSLFSRLHRSGVGYVAAAAAFFVVYSVGNRPGSAPAPTAMDDSVLRYARLLPADFDLKGDASALPAVVSEVVGAPAASSPRFEMQLPARLEKKYVPREGRFFSAPGGKLGVAIQLRAPRSAEGSNGETPKPKTLYMMPSSPDVEDVLPQSNMAHYVKLGGQGGEAVSFDDETRGTWKSGNLNYVLMDQ